jgi:GNAT superfamily N-acetyltransferase
MLPDGTQIVRARLEEIPALSKLLGELFRIERDFTPDPVRQSEGLRLLIEREHDAAVFVARDPNGRVLGMVSAQLVISTAEGAPSAWVEDVVVESASRKRGIGRALLRAVLGWARDAGATRAQLLIDTGNHEAEAFYAKLGWQETRLGARRLAL